MQFITDNLATILLSGVVFAVFAAIVRSQWKKFTSRSGGCGCGCGCSGCGGSCGTGSDTAKS
ncbi:MAG: FeoB-associated Cys-rich membrane protein [Mailhella sp.]|nr:FeoB-associated Cys-rich membrane protein [Mailhella sp.]